LKGLIELRQIPAAFAGLFQGAIPLQAAACQVEKSIHVRRLAGNTSKIMAWLSREGHCFLRRGVVQFFTNVTKPAALTGGR
jgi:hypothetical protein